MAVKTQCAAHLTQHIFITIIITRESESRCGAHPQTCPARCHKNNEESCTDVKTESARLSISKSADLVKVCTSRKCMSLCRFRGKPQAMILEL